MKNTWFTSIILTIILSSGLLLASCNTTNIEPAITNTLEAPESESAVTPNYLSTELPVVEKEDEDSIRTMTNAQTPNSSVSITVTSSENEIPSLTSTMDISATITMTPTITLTPTRTSYPTRTTRPTRTPKMTPTPTPGLATYRINNLGPYSKVISPVRPEAIVSPGEDGYIFVELIGEDGKIITKQGLNFYNYLGRRVGIAPEIEFTLEKIAETARLSISTYDLQGRTIALTSVELVLLKMGSNQIMPPSDLTEPYIIRQPEADDEIQGGMLKVVGLARILNINPLIIECIDDDGKIITATEVQISPPTEEFSHVPFEAYLPYQIDEPTDVRLTIRQESNTRIPGTISLYSFEITLLP